MLAYGEGWKKGALFWRKEPKDFSDAVADSAGATNTCSRKSLLLLFFSPVLVDTTTRDAITQGGNCDALVLGAGNCPVTYTNGPNLTVS